MSEIFNAYSNVIVTALTLLGVIIFLWLLLLVNGLFRNPLRICNKSIIKSLKWIDLLEKDIKEKRYNKRTDSYVFFIKDKIDVLNRYIRQFSYENNDDRASNITSKIKTIEISLDILRKVYLQRGADEALALVISSKIIFKEINEMINIFIQEEKLYNTYKNK